MYCIRRRQRIQGAFAIGAKGTPAYGLLRVDDLDHEDAGAGKHYIDIEEKEAAARLDGSEHERTPTR